MHPVDLLFAELTTHAYVCRLQTTSYSVTVITESSTLASL